MESKLTPRERDVMHLVAQGRTNKQIGRKLVISEGTVKIHVEHIFLALDVHNRAQAVRKAFRLGLET